MNTNASYEKVSSSHLSRDAWLYVRQSTLRQVFENTESTHRQYALRQQAVALGWPVERVQVIDCDLGKSAASEADREGFQRLVTEVSMGRAGIVLGLEVSRLARNNCDWHRLLEICAVTGTLILDEDGLYDPGHFNDRLLLGLKGTMMAELAREAWWADGPSATVPPLVHLAVSAPVVSIDAGGPRTPVGHASDTGETARDASRGRPRSGDSWLQLDGETKSEPPHGTLRSNSGSRDAAGKTIASIPSTDNVFAASRSRRLLAKPHTSNHHELGSRELVLPTGQVSERSPGSSPRRFFTTAPSPPRRCPTCHSDPVPWPRKIGSLPSRAPHVGNGIEQSTN